MIKKTTFLLALLVSGFVCRSQITSISYPSGYLSEEKITQILEKSRKSGTKEWELQRHKEHLYQLLVKQNQAIANGTFGQRTILPPPIATLGCTNVGFEDGTTNGWTMYQGSNNTGGTLPCPTCFTSIGGVYEVTSMGANSAAMNNAGNTTGGDASASCSCGACNEPYTSGLDYYGSFPVVAPAPLGGNHSLLLNNANCGYLMQRASQSFNVTALNNSFTYQYAVVLQDGTHPINESPYFQVSVLDGTGTSIPCMQLYDAATSGTIAGWTTSTHDASVFYKNWTTVALDLTAYIGQTVTINFDVSDCNQGGHFGYAYIDASCNPLQITASNNLCAGGSTILQGPPGMATYSWTGPATGNTQNLVTGTTGNYTLTTTSATSCTNTSTFYYSLTSSSTASPTVSVVASHDSICSGATTTLTASGANTYTWSNSASTSSITVSPSANTTYTVTGIDTMSGCAGSVTQTIHVNIVVNIHAAQDTVCTGTPAILTANGADTYTWSSNAGGAITNPVSVSPVANTTYSVVGTNTVSGCTNSATQMVYIKSCTTGIDQVTNNNQVIVYPNPANNILIVPCKLKNSTLYISDILGNKIKQINIENELTSIDMSSLNEGVYFINIKTANSTITKKIIVQH